MSTDEDRSMAGRSIVAKVLAEEARKLGDHVRQMVEPALEPGEHLTGQLGDGTRVGKVRRNERATTAAVTDEQALINWILEHRPDEVVPQIRPSYLEHLRAQVKAHGHAFDATSGEVIPGIEAVQGGSSFVVSPSAEGRELIRRRLAEMTGGLLELPAPEQDRKAS